MTEAKVPRRGWLWRLLPPVFGTLVMLYVSRDFLLSSRQSAPVETPFRVTGKVVDDSGQPSGPGVILVRRRPGRSFSDLLDPPPRWSELPCGRVTENGSFVAYTPAAGSYQLMARIRGRDDSTPLEVESTLGTVTLTAPLQAGPALPRIAGQVLDERGRPMAGVEVWIRVAQRMTGDWSDAHDVCSTEGRFELFAHDRETYRLSLRNDGIDMPGPSVAAPAQDLRIVLTEEQRRGGALEVSVVDWQGNAVDGGMVAIWRSEPNGVGAALGHARVARIRRGRGALDGLCIGDEAWLEYHGGSTLQGGAPDETTWAPIKSAHFVIAAQQQLQLVVRPWAIVPVRVLDADDHAVAGAQVMVRLLDETMSSRYQSEPTQQSDADGHLQLWLPPGHVQLSAIASTGFALNIDATFEPGRNDEQVLRLTRH